MIRSLISILVLATLFISPTSGQDNKEYDAARRQFKKDVRKNRLSKRRVAIRRMRATKDVRAVKEMLTQIHIARRKAAPLIKKMGPLLAKRSKISKNYEKKIDQFHKSNPAAKKANQAPASLINQFEKKLDEIAKKLGPIEISERLETNTKNMLLTALGDLITNLDEQAQQEQTKFFLDQYEKKKGEEKAIYIEILSYVRNAQSAVGLVGIANNDSDVDARVAALSGLGRLGDHRGGKAAKLALTDEYFQVRAAALEAMRSFASYEMIPVLIDRIDQEDGRLKGDVIETLELLAGISFQENVTLWKKWWTEKKDTLKEILTDLEAENAVQISIGLEKMDAHGFLLAARRILHKRGVSLAAIRSEEARRLVDPDPDAQADTVVKLDEDDELMAVAHTIAGCTEQIRKIAFKALVLDPFYNTWNPARRRELIHLIGLTGREKGAAILARMLRPIRKEDREKFQDRQLKRDRNAKNRVAWRWSTHESKLAALALANCATAKEVEALGSLLNDGDDDKRSYDRDVLLAAVKALKKIDDSNAVRELIASLRAIEELRDEKRNELAGVTKAISDALRELTGEKLGSEFASWKIWKTSLPEDWKTPGQKDREKNEGALAKNDKAGGTRFYGIKTYSKRVIFIMDISGSMSEPAEENYDGRSGKRKKLKIDVAKDELLKAIASLPKDALFNLIFYSTEYRTWKTKMQKANAAGKKSAKEWVAEAEAGGGTNIYGPLMAAFDIAGRGTKDKSYKGVSVDTIFFLSDGHPTAGAITDPEDIVTKVAAANKLKKVQIHTVGVGKGHLVPLMKLLAESSGGQYIAR